MVGQVTDCVSSRTCVFTHVLTCWIWTCVPRFGCDRCSSGAWGSLQATCPGEDRPTRYSKQDLPWQPAGKLRSHDGSRLLDSDASVDRHQMPFCESWCGGLPGTRPPPKCARIPTIWSWSWPLYDGGDFRQTSSLTNATRFEHHPVILGEF